MQSAYFSNPEHTRVVFTDEDGVVWKDIFTRTVDGVVVAEAACELGGKLAKFQTEGGVVSSYVARTPTTYDVIDERKRRLAQGFAYDFGDARGVHHIGTTEADMAGWDEVSKVAQAAVLVGLPATLISIETNTGSVTISAQEWQQILLAAGRFRQPIWKASFDLVKLDPIPSNYQEDQYWS